MSRSPVNQQRGAGDSESRPTSIHFAIAASIMVGWNETNRRLRCPDASPRLGGSVGLLADEGLGGESMEHVTIVHENDKEVAFSGGQLARVGDEFHRSVSVIGRVLGFVGVPWLRSCGVAESDAGEPGAAAVANRDGAGLASVSAQVTGNIDKEHQPFSIDAQEPALTAYVKSQPSWTLTVTYSDGASGSTAERPNLQRALRAPAPPGSTSCSCTWSTGSPAACPTSSTSWQS